jgi:hypothetical protein
MKIRLTADEEDGLFQLLRSLHTFLTACEDETCPELRSQPKEVGSGAAPLNGIPSPARRPDHSHAYARSTTPSAHAHPADADQHRPARSDHPHPPGHAPGRSPAGSPAPTAAGPAATGPAATPPGEGHDQVPLPQRDRDGAVARLEARRAAAEAAASAARRA